MQIIEKVADMTINDLNPGMSCTLLTMRKRGKYQADSTILKISNHDLFVDAVTVNGRIVNFGHTSNFLIINLQDRVPQIFQYIVPQLTREDGRYCYKINLKYKLSVIYDRRNNFRLPLNKSVSARFDVREARQYQCLLKNISAVGFGLVLDRTNLPKDYKLTGSINITFSDSEPEYGMEVSFNLTGSVKRIINTKDGRILFGCQFPYSLSIEQYIHDKKLILQRLRKREYRA